MMREGKRKRAITEKDWESPHLQKAVLLTQVDTLVNPPVTAVAAEHARSLVALDKPWKSSVRFGLNPYRRLQSGILPRP